MGKIHAGATLTPGFREFLPVWLVRQTWYRGPAVPDSVALVGSFRFEDPDGEVGIETHLVSVGGELYQVPMTYRGAALAGAAPEALIATPEHSVLGPRWIYDGEADPVWRGQVVELVRAGGVSTPGGRGGALVAEARGERLGAVEPSGSRVEVVRVVAPGLGSVGPDVVGRVVGTWQVDGAPVSGLLAVVRGGPAGG